MRYQELEDAYQRYREDPDTAHELFSACLATATQQSSVWAWGHDSHFDREAIAQEAVIAAFLALPTLKPETLFSWWFLRVIRNKCSDAIRQRITRREEHLAVEYSGSDEWESSFPRLLDAAGSNVQLITELAQDYDLHAVAEKLGITVGAVKQRLQHIKSVNRKAS